MKSTPFQLFILLLDLLLLIFCLFLHVVDKEEILDGVASILDLDVDLLSLEEVLQLLTGLFPEGVGEFVGRCQGLRPEGQFFRGGGFPLTGDSFLIEELKVLEDLLLFLRSKESALVGSDYNNRDELLQFLGLKCPKVILLSKQGDNLLYKMVVVTVFIGVEVDIEDFFEDGEGDERVNLIISGQFFELRVDLLEDQCVGVSVDLRRHHEIDLLSL